MSFTSAAAHSSQTTTGASFSPTTVASGVDDGSVLLISSAVILLLSVICGIVGNVLVCVSVYRNRNLRTANNAVLVNLAVADLVVCFTGIPIMLAEVFNSFSDCHPYGGIICPVQTFFHVTSSSVQLVTLVSISFERYEAIVRPFETKKKRRRVIVGTTLSWIMAIVIAVPASVLLKKSSLYLLCTCQLHEQPSDYVHILIISPLGIGCLVCVVLFYLKIFRTVRKHVKEKHQSRDSYSGETRRTEKRLQNLLRSYCCCCCSRTNVVGAVSDLPGQPVIATNSTPPTRNMIDRPSVSGLQSVQNWADNRIKDTNEESYGGRSSPNNPVGIGEQAERSVSPDTGVGSFGAPQENTDRKQIVSARQDDPVKGPASNTLQPKALVIAIVPATPSGVSPSAEERPQLPDMASQRVSVQENSASRRKSGDIQGSVCVLNPEMRIRGRRNLEAKTAKRASYIIGVFSLCWLPLFVMSYVESRTEVDVFVTCIATMSAALNPIVYTVVNKSFRTEFVKIFRKLTRCCPERCKWLPKP
ncbi:D(2) dopamine receptor-like [Acanthaster planci]|uniref:D(2) dopamine receptor-like n=1 Tax=Acanthaster planci TaxID=133434 RepID=A0A8B7ZLY2_ACAPL|nr:D(2) dopamine receptor-like [Acanthaster planci]XP_022106460.1 D(2) dopamine receptor-like [Acanthaster planci]